VCHTDDYVGECVDAADGVDVETVNVMTAAQHKPTSVRC
jgi:hypothetical protein